MRYILKIKADKTLDSVIDDLSMNNAIKLNALHKIIVDTDDDDVLDTWKNHDSIIRITQDRLHTISYIDAGTTVAGTPTNTSVVAGAQNNLDLGNSTFYWHLDAMSKEDFNASSNGKYNYEYDGLGVVDLVIVDSGIAGTLNGAGLNVTTAGWGSCSDPAIEDEYGCTAATGTWTPDTPNPTIGYEHPDMINIAGQNRVKPLPNFNLTLNGQYDSPQYNSVITMPNGKDWNNEDTHGHGTQCAQFAAGIHAGICKQANIYSCKVMDLMGTDSGSGWFSDITKGLDAVLAWHIGKNGSIPTVINYSIGKIPTAPTNLLDYDDEGDPGDDIDDNMRLLTNAGIHVCIAAGNGYMEGVEFRGPLDTKVVEPARMSGPHWTTGIESDTISVGATDWQGINGVYNATGLTANVPWEMAFFSDYGSAVTISAPGTGLNAIGWYDQTPGTGAWGFTSGFQGTSFSSPLVAGLVCIKINENITTGKAPQGGTPAEIKAWLRDSAKVDNYFSSWLAQHGEQGSHTDSQGNVTSTGDALVQTIKYNNDYMYILHSGIADHATGPFPGSSGAGYIPADKSYIKAIARNPLKNVDTRTSTPVGVVGVMVNGVPLFNVKDEYSWDTSATTMSKTLGDGVWFKNSWKVDATTKDAHYGFCTSDFRYNYKTSSPTLRAELNDTYTTGTPNHSPIIGWALDGYPIYGPFGYGTATNASSGITKMVPGWREKVLAEYDPGGDSARTCSVRITAGSYSSEHSSTWGPDVDSTYPIGTFIQDYIYDSTVSNRHLDQYNGRTCVTPEFPNGTYAYFATIETTGNAYDGEPMFPYVLADEYYGYVPSGNIGQDAVTVPSDATIWNKYGGNSLNKITKILTEVKLPTDPFAVTNTTGDIVITWPGHGLKTNDWIQIRGALQGAGFFGSVEEQGVHLLDPAGIETLNSWVLDDWHMVQTVPDLDHIQISFLFHPSGATATGNIGGDNVHISVLKTGATSTPADLTTHESTDGLLKTNGPTVGTYVGISGDWSVDYTSVFGGASTSLANKRKWRLRWYTNDTAPKQAPPGQFEWWHIEYTPVTITPNKMAFMPYSQNADWNITWATTPGNFSTFKTADVVNRNLSTTFTNWANENIGEVVYTLIGPIPSELSFNNRTGYLTGTLGTYETSSTYAFTINANNGYFSQTQNYSFSISEAEEVGYHYDGANLILPGRVLDNWIEVKTNNYQLAVNKNYMIDSGALTGLPMNLTLPSTAKMGDRIVLLDATRTTHTNSWVIDTNGIEVLGQSQPSGEWTVNTQGVQYELVYFESTRSSSESGWVVRETT